MLISLLALTSFLTLKKFSLKILFLDFRNVSAHRLLSYSSIEVGDKTSKKPADKPYSSFEGQMQQLVINGKSFFELIDNNEIPNIVNKTVTFIRNGILQKYPITFFNKHSWIELPPIDASQILLIMFIFKTTHENGLIMHNPGNNGDFLSVELVDGQIIYTFSLGKAIYELKSNVRKKLNDNKWHSVSIWRSTRTSHELTVDSLLYKHTLVDEKHLLFNLIDNLNFGGLKEPGSYEILRSKKRIRSSHGFQGCLASIELNGQIPNFDHVWTDENKMNGNISKGCGGK